MTCDDYVVVGWDEFDRWEREADERTTEYTRPVLLNRLADLTRDPKGLRRMGFWSAESGHLHVTSILEKVTGEYIHLIYGIDDDECVVAISEIRVITPGIPPPVPPQP